jgi:hypothetical protein
MAAKDIPYPRGHRFGKPLDALNRAKKAFYRPAAIARLSFGKARIGLLSDGVVFKIAGIRLYQ